MGSYKPKAPHVLLVDDHLMVLDLLGAYLTQLQPPMIVSTATSVLQALALVEKERGLNLVVLDRQMPDMDGLTGLQHLRRLRPDLPVAMLSGAPSTSAVHQARETGAVGYINKTTGAAGIARALLRILAGEVYFPDPLQADEAGGGILTPNSPPPPRAGGLSQRENDVLDLLAAGRPNKEIARSLDITPATVSFHLTQIYRKLGASTRTEAVRMAFERGLVAAHRA